MKKRITSLMLILVVAVSMTMGASAASYIPDDVTYQNLNGQQLAIKTYTLLPDQDPSDLYEDDFEYDGFLYSMSDIVKEEQRYSLSLNAATLRLVQGEYVTDVRFEFGTVPSGFSSVVKPTMRVQVLGTVSNGYQIINRADVGGQYLNEWQTAKTTWVTTVRRFNTTPLPKTGY